MDHPDESYDAYWQRDNAEEEARLARELSPESLAFLREYIALCEKHNRYLAPTLYDLLVICVRERVGWGWFLRGLSDETEHSS